jgi:ABC-2 type transport system ATP-binding protein
MAAEKMIETWGLTKRFGSLAAVDSIAISVKKGTIHGFIGPNGAGKSTTMKLLIGALRPTSGGGTIGGYPIGSLEARAVFGFSPERPSFYGDMTGFNYLVYMGRVSGLDRPTAESRADELLKELDLGEAELRKVEGFSAGMRQELSLAQAMIHEPQLLVLDEPTANLDPVGRMRIIRKLKELREKRDMTVFISSHILSELEQLVDDFTVINHGRIVSDKSLGAEIRANEYLLRASDSQKVLRALLKSGFNASIDGSGTIRITAPGNEAEFKRQVVKTLAASDASLEAFGKAVPDLEKVFMRLVGEGGK